MLHDSLVYLLIVPSIIGGVSWAGFHLAAGNFIYDNVNPKKRGLAISYYNMFIGIGTFLGAGLSALLIKYWEISLVEPIIAIFFLSAIIRALIVIGFLNRIKEKKKRRKIKGFSELRNVVIHQAKPVLIEEIHDIISINKYLKK
jgi:MFS family permease